MIRRTLIFVTVLLLTLPAVCRAQEKRLTLDDVVGRKVSLGGRTRIAAGWLPDSAHYIQYTREGISQVDARTGEEAPASGMQATDAAFSAVPGLEAGAAKRLAFFAFQGVIGGENPVEVADGNDLYLYDTATKKVAAILTGIKAEHYNTKLSPDKKHIAYTKADNNLYVWDIATKTERKLTRDGALLTLNGRLDWVYEEEVYGRGTTTGFKWSSDSSRIAFLRIDESPVKPFTLVDHTVRQQKNEQEYYPLAGDPNPVATLWTVSVTGNAPAKAVDLSKYPPTDRIIARFNWKPDGKLTFQVQNRIQTWLDLNTADPATGSTKTLFRETSPAWVDVLIEPRYLKDGSFLWESDHTGFRHLYHYKADGTLIGAVTKGDWSVRNLLGVDEKNGVLYFDGTEHSAIQSHLYRVSLDGSGAITRLTQQEGSHTVALSPDFTLFTDSYSSHDTPPRTQICDTKTGATVRSIAETRSPALDEYKLGTTRLVKVPMRDGTILDGMLLLPPDFDPKKKYPVFYPIYGGPETPNLNDTWFSGGGNVEYQFLAQNGYIVWHFDNRSATIASPKFVQTAYKHFGEGELRDIDDSIQWLTAQGFVDPARIGISGWSFGGFLTQYALTHSKLFKVGIAGAGVSDWHLYDSIYTERYMSTPQLNPEGYQSTSNVNAAANLSGKLLLIHGTVDDNVHMQNTIQLVDALEKADKDFQLMLYPRSRHGISDPLLNHHLQNLMVKFVLDNL